MYFFLFLFSRIIINVLKSIIICFIGQIMQRILLQYERKEHDIHTNQITLVKKKKKLDSYSKKYTYSYSFRMSVVFLTETIWFVSMSCSFISSCKSILCMICPMNQIIIDSSILILILNKKKKEYIDSYFVLDSCPRMP